MQRKKDNLFTEEDKSMTVFCFDFDARRKESTKNLSASSTKPSAMNKTFAEHVNCRRCTCVIRLYITLRQIHRFPVGR